ncbi:MAG: BON domain-containing protein, partial [Gemmatimonadales bacterium]
RAPQAPRAGTAATVRTARKALEESDQRDLGLTIMGVSPGVVELHGWVATRAMRARAGRILRAVPGIETVHIRVLVRGEDDALPGPNSGAVDQPA